MEPERNDLPEEEKETAADAEKTAATASVPDAPPTDGEADAEQRFAKQLEDLPGESLGEERVEPRGKNTRRILYDAVLVLVVGVFLFCLYNFVKRLVQYNASEKIYDYEETDTDAPSLLTYTEKSEKTPAISALGTHHGASSELIIDPPGEGDPYLTDKMRLEKWKSVNPEVYGWIEIPGDTQINYPLVFPTNNEWYLTYAADGSFNPAGSIFVECRCQKPLSRNFNTVIWGHHMDFGAPMFANLLKYGEDPDYLKEKDNRYVKIYTEEDGMQVYEIFAAYKMGIYFEERSCFDSMIYEWGDKVTFLEKIEERNLLKNTRAVGPDDEFVSLCTCADSGTMRFTVQAVRIDPDAEGNYPV